MRPVTLAEAVRSELATNAPREPRSWFAYASALWRWILAEAPALAMDIARRVRPTP